jgi:Protein of unknown function (DUF998)
VSQTIAHSSPSLHAASPTTATRWSLVAGAVAGPIWIAVAAVQATLRDGFDLRRHPISVLSNGDLGWIQITSFVVCGLLMVVGATGLRRSVVSRRGATWLPRLMTVVGIGMVASGVFVADPLDGFPEGTPLGRPDELSAHGALHYLFSSVSFIALVAAAFVFARRSRAEGGRWFARYSVSSAIAFLVSWAAVMTAQDNDLANVAFAAVIAVMFVWTSALFGYVRRRV